jgi:nucleoside-diphosphate-sugar epimerase
MTTYEQAKDRLLAQPFAWLITGVAGFIDSNLAEALLKLNQRVIVRYGKTSQSRTNQGRCAKQWARFTFIEGDIRDLRACRCACNDVHYVLHQAALCSVPQSIEDPIHTNESNVTGFLNMLVAARDGRVKRFVYAASCATYGDRSAGPQVEEHIGNPLSPYAVTFCYIENVTQANVLAATTSRPSAVNQIYNVGVNARTSLNQLILLLYESLKPFYPHLKSFKATHNSFRPGDVRDSQADICKAARLLGYEPSHTVQAGLNTALEWYRQNL